MLMAFAGLMGLVMIGSLLDLSPDPITPDDDEAAPEPADELRGIEGTPLDDMLLGDAGRDAIMGHDGDDQMSGHSGDDLLDGGAGADRVFGDAGRDVLTGASGHDLLHGGADGDVIAGGDGTDQVWGDDGDDTLSGGEGGDSLTGGAGNDRLAGDGGDDALLGWDGDDSLAGGAGRDTLQGGQGDDVLDGWAEEAAAARDYLNGGAGDDTILAGGGDWATGDDGADRFVIGDWLTEDVPPPVIADYDAAADTICLIYDPGAHPDPVVTLAAVQGEPDLTHILLDGLRVGTVAGGAGLSVSDIALLRSDDLAA